MYHYVREYDHNFPNFRFLDYSNFKLQLDYFEEKYGFVAREEWDDFISGSENRNLNNKIVLTFDDAMSCHYDYVYPELLKRGLWGIFYVPVLPYINGEILDVHRIHLLCGKYHGEELYKILKDVLEYSESLEHNPFQLNDNICHIYQNIYSLKFELHKYEN